MRQWFVKLRYLFRRDEIARNLREEMDAHFEIEVRERIASGVPEEAARADARRRFGSSASIHDRVMDAWSLGFWDILLQDIRYAIRTLWRTPAFTIAALLSLAVGTGASTAIFSLMNALLWKKLPVPEPDRLVLVWPHTSSGVRVDYIYHHVFLKFRERSSVFSGVSATSVVDRSNIILDGNGSNPGPLHAGLVSGDYFTTLGVQAAAGRMFTPDDERTRSGSSVVVISHSFWREKFNSAPDTVGRTIRLNQTIFTVVGVAARDFRGDWTGRSTDLWFPFTMVAAVLPAVPPQGPHPTRVLARLKPGITISQAQAASQVLYQQLLTESAAQLTPQLVQEIARERIELQPAATGYSPQREILATPVTILTVLTVLILLAGCANVANLLLARATARQREMAVRAAIGAGRMRIARQAVTETILLAIAGGLAGMVFASISTSTLSAMLASGPASIRNDAASSVVSLAPHLYQDAKVFVFTALVCLLAGMAFGAIPALRFSSSPVANALTDRDVAAGGGGVRKVLVVVQVTLSMILLCGAALFLTTLDNLKRQDLGFDRDHLLIARVDVSQTGRTVPALATLFETVTRQMLSVPGVMSASMGPLLTGSTNGGGSESWRIEGQIPKPGLLTARAGVAPGFFATAGTPLLAGREFNDRDTAASPRVAILNQTMARFFFGDENPIGKRMGASNESGYPTEIVGVVKDQKAGGARDRRGFMYVPFAQQPNQLRAPWCIVLRTAADPNAIANAVRQRLQAIDPAMPIFSISAIREQLDDVLAQERLLTIFSVSFALMATLLASIGLYGMMAYATARRTREFGIRIALGATTGGVRGLVLKDSVILALAGIVAGVPLTIAGARGASAMLFGVGTADWRVLVLAAALLALVSVAAGLVPANRASRIHPSDALRHE